VRQRDQLTVVLFGELVDHIRVEVHEVILHASWKGDERLD
jgi:hypothetical protein